MIPPCSLADFVDALRTTGCPTVTRGQLPIDEQSRAQHCLRRDLQEELEEMPNLPADPLVWHPDARCFAVPTSAAEPEPAGLLLLPGPGAPARFSRRIIPCTIEYDKVAVPCGHQMDPVLTGEEARRLLFYPAYFFHPTLGLIAFEPEDAVTADSLIVPPLLRSGSWMHATAGPPPPPPLKRVSLLLSDDPSSLFGDSAQDIASEPSSPRRRHSPPLHPD